MQSRNRPGIHRPVLALALALGALGWLAAAGSAEAARSPRRSADGVWTRQRASGAEGAALAESPGRRYTLNRRALKRILRRAPLERAGDARGRRVVLTLPLPDGTFGRFRIEQSPILSPELRRRHRSISTYRAQGVDDPTATARLDLTPLGFHAQVLSASGTVLVDPAGGAYRSARKSDLAPTPFECGVGAAELVPGFGPLAANPSGDRLVTFRLAVTATGEYTTFFGGEPAAFAQIVTTVNRLTGIYEREVAVRFTLVDAVIYDDPDTDPFPAGSSVNGDLLDQNQADLDTTVGAANYDIGHIFSQGGSGGLASVGVACVDGSKGRGGTSRPDPSGDPFDVDYVAHEIGHQMGGHHTFNGTTSSCGGTNRNADTAYEPGSGSTIMAYAGICGAENVQPHSDDYFHTASFDEITGYRDGGGAACGSEVPTGNGAPVVDAGPDYVVPRGTPFTLTAAAVDPEGDALTFCWEQFDLGAESPPPNVADGPLFRSRPPAASPSRTFPAFADLLAGVPTPWERLPEADRTLTFRATARDGRTDGGGVDYDTMTLTVSGEPFAITAPAPGGSLECGDAAALAWQVGGGAVAAEVRPLISVDGGLTFAELLAATPNDGAEAVPVPRALTPTARLLLEAVDNVFFALSGPLSVDDTLPPAVTAPADLPGVECTSPAGASPDLGTPAVADLCDDAPAVGNDAPAVFPFGTTTVTWTATDASGNSGGDTQDVTVVDTTPPDIAAPPDVTAECTSPAGTPVDLGTPVVSDVCDDSVAVSNDAPALFPLGLTSVLWTAVDDFGNAASDGQQVTVVDTTAPEFTLELSPTVLWPPNHRLATIRATIAVSDTCDASPVVTLVSIESDEPDNGTGDGNTEGDVAGADFGTDDREFQVRAERSGGGDGRVYTVTYEARDASGNASVRTATVTVPHDRGN